MTQDQYDQARGPGYVVRGDVVPEDETEEARTDESRPMTRFQKVASALRGGSERDEQDLDADDRAADDRAAAERASSDRTAAEAQAGAPEASGSNLPWVTREDEAAMAGSPISREPAQKRDYWDDPDAAAGHEDNAVAVTSPDTPDHQATEPDMFGTAGAGGHRRDARCACGGSARCRDHRGRPGGPYPVGEPTAGAAPADDVSPAGDVPAATDGRGDGEHRAARRGHPGRRRPRRPGPSCGPARRPIRGLRPGEAAGKLGDFSDLTYGNLVPDAEQFTAQWQEIQFRFVDDPRGSVTEAADVVAQVTAKMEAAIQERQRAIEERQRAIAEQQRSLRGRWGEDSNADTEALRETLRMYKTFLDQLIGSRAS